jgi:hypothetical protein
MNRDRQSTRLSISIPLVISGVDADGDEFSENVRTLIINKHGGKILTTQHLAMGAEVTIQNPAMDAVAKASVAWLSETHRAGDLHAVGLQLLEAQNVWGIAFPPDDWRSEAQEEETAAPGRLPAGVSVNTINPAAPVSSLAGEEITIQLLQEMQDSADAHARDFQERLKQLSQRVGLELELHLRKCAARMREREVVPLEEEIKGLRERLSAAREEMAKLEAGIQELKSHLPAPAGNPSPMTLHEAHRQLTALANSVVESMNRAAEDGLREYRNLLHAENQESAARRRPTAEHNPPPPKGT